MKTPVLMAVIAGLHICVVGMFILIQGCGTPQGAASVEPPPPAPMPPKETAGQPELRSQPVTPQPVTRQPSRPATPPADTKVYTVQKGDMLSTIARQAGVTTRELIELNQLQNPDRIRVGQELLLPPYANDVGRAGSGTSATAGSPSSASSAASGGEYVVKKGDSLSKIAAEQGTTVKALQRANDLSDADFIRIGQTLTIPGGAVSTSSRGSSPSPASTEEAPAPEPAPAPATPAEPAVSADDDRPAPTRDDAFPYTVIEGETLSDIAANFGVLKEDLMKLNNLEDPAGISAGDEILIPEFEY